MDDEVAGRQPLEDVARHDAPERPRPADPDGPEQLAIRDEGQPVRSAGEPAVQAAVDDRDGAGRRRFGDALDHRDGLARLFQQVREAGRLVRGQDDARPVRAPAGDGIDHARRPAERERRLAPPEDVTGRQGAAGHRGPDGRVGLPGQLQRPRAGQPRLPVLRGEIGGGPVLRQLARLDQLGAPLVGLAPQELGGLGDIARLVEDEQRAGAEVVEAGRGREMGGPDLGGVPDDHRTGRAGRRRGRGAAAGPEPLVLGAFEARQVRVEPLRQPGRRTPETGPDGRRAARGEQELRCRQEHRVLHRPHGPLVGRVEGPQRIDLVAEELDADRQRQRWGEDVDDAAALRELATPGHLEDRHVAESEEVAQQRVLVEPQASLQPARLGRQVVGDQRVLEQRLDARDQDARPAAPPGGEGRDARGRLVGDELAPLVRQRRARLEDDDRLRVAQPGAQLLGDPVADLGVARDPGEPLAGVRERERGGEIGLRAMGHREEPGMAADATGVVVRAAQALAQRRERPGRRQQRRERGQVGQPVPIRRSRLGRVATFRRRTSHPGIATGLGPTRVLGFGIDRGQVEVDRVLLGDRPVPGGQRRGGLLGQPSVAAAPAADRRRRALSHRRRPPRADGPCASRSSCGGRHRRRAGRRPRRARRAGPCPPVGARTC